MNQNSKYPNINNFNPRSCISGKIRRCNRIIAQVFRKYLLPFDVTSSQLSILFICSKKGTVTQKELADFLILEKSTVSRNMRRLFEKGILKKENKKEISLTETGFDFLETVIPEWDKAMKEIRKILEKEGEAALHLLETQLGR